ncbi:sensor histidine kinase [Acidovorax sp. Root267]|uniref:sensor histidine kinase n=1 Tax=Acidovorax sp. Root267 TaxID=1736505 RepID=UPI0009EB8822|nr:sensor histidine kinase [Acidovorax sp. Root267]
MLLCSAVQAQVGADTIDIAQAYLEPEGAPAWSGQVKLPHLWDKAYPGLAGRARYQLVLPPVAPDGVLRGLYFPRVGNQVEIYVGGDLIAHRGVLGDSRNDATKAPLWVPVPTSLLSSTASTALEVRVAVQPVRWGGLAAPRFGPEATLLPQYRERYIWRQWGAVAVVFALALTGVVAGGLWHLNREPVYGYFALCAPFGMLRYGDRLWETSPLGWPLWGGIVAFSLTVHMLLLVRFALALVGRDGVGARRGFWMLLAAEASLVVGGFGFGQPWCWTAALALLFVPAFWAYAVAAREALVARQPEAIALCLASFIPIGAGLYDFLEIRVSTESVGRSSYLPLATMLFVLLMGWLILNRYARQVRAYQGLSNSLDEKVRQREQELQVSYALLQQEHAQHAALLERQRIMRDIHDGVGSQLVGLLSLIGKGRTNAQLREHANAALDELRMAVDAIQPVGGDLATVLATLRYRMQPRLAATGIQVDWQVEELPALESLTPHMVLQIQRLLLEAFTNVLRHAQASTVRVSARHQDGPGQPPHLVLEIADNGVGMERSAQLGGQGLANMRARAQAIGAQLEITAAPGQGTCVRVALPMAPEPVQPAIPAPAPAAPASRWP